jgi:hypothetical protein
MRAIFLAPALLLSTLALTPASAAPVAPLHDTAIAAPVTLAQYSHHGSSRHHSTTRHRSNTRYRSYHRSRPHFYPGHHYRSAPRGWHRYHSRPYNWRTRGCVVVGPVWFCP